MPPQPIELLNWLGARRPLSAVRRSGLPAVFAILCVAALLGSIPATGQFAVPPAPGEPATPDASDSEPPLNVLPTIDEPIQYVGPDTYILLDEQGRPQPVPGMTYEDFMAAWKQAQKVHSAERRPRFTIENIEIDGHAAGRHAELHFKATVHLLTDEAVDVPLGLVGAILQGKAQFDPASPATDGTVAETNDNSRHSTPESYLDYDPDGGGFVARLAGRASERYTVSLNLLVPLSRDGAGTTLALTCPRAVSSKLTLDVDSAVTEATVTSGTLITQEPSGGGTRLAVAGPMGPFRLTWRTAEAELDQYATVLSAEGAIRVAIDGRSVRTDARLTVRSYGASFDRFRVRLPPGARLVEKQQPDSTSQNAGYRISIEDDSLGGATGGGGREQTALVELPESQRGPVVVELATEQPLGLDDDLAAELEGFEVLGAVRQFGDVALYVASDWQARWDVGRYARQVDKNEIDSLLQQPDLTAAFQYDRQPWSLDVRIAPRQFRVLVAPAYELECTSEEARLTVRLTYQVLGARAFEFRVQLAGWELAAEPVESGGRVDRNQIAVMEDGVLVLPLAQASSRRAEITFTVKRALPRDAKRLRLPLPVPLADSVGTGELIVRAATDINLLPDITNSIGLTPMAVAEPPSSNAGDNDTEFRFRSMVPDAVFAADRVNRTREVLSEVVSHISINESDVLVDQRIAYVVRYESVKELVLEAPLELTANEEGIKIAVVPSGENIDSMGEPPEAPLALTSSIAENPSTESAFAGQIRVALPQPQMGQFSLHIRYSLPRPTGASSTGAWRLPLLRPTEGLTNAHRAIVEASLGLSVSLDAKAGQSSWQPEASRHGRQPLSAYEFVTDRPEVYLPLIVRQISLNTPSTTSVERVWLQSWLSGDMRQDRAAFRFRTTASQAVVELPPQTPAANVEVLLDRQEADVLSRNAERMVVDLGAARNAGSQAADSQPELHTLELRFRRPSGDAVVTRHGLTPPQLVGTTALSEVYWHVVLPGDQHVVRSPVQMTTASAWQWLGSFWGRRPTRSQAELEQWVGASTQFAPSPAQNEYLFTGLAPLSSIELITAPRWLIVLAASAGVLLLVLAWLYVPVLRRGWMVAAVASLLAGLALAFPTPALLLAQASVLGVLLATLAVLMARIVARPARWTVVIPPASSSPRQSTIRPDSVVMPALATTASSAPTISVRAPDSE